MLERIKSWKVRQTRMSWGFFLNIYDLTNTTAEWNGRKSICYSHVKSQSNDESCRIHNAIRQQLWSEAAQTATHLENILVQDSSNSPPFTQCFGVDAKYAKHLRVFGEMCIVVDTDNKVGRTMIDPRGEISLFVGYSTHHARDVYRLLIPNTSRDIHSRDAKWTGKTWVEFYKIKMIDRASGYVDPVEDFRQEEEEDQDIDEEDERNPSRVRPPVA